MTALPMQLAGSARTGGAAVLVGVACGRGLHMAASIVLRLCGSVETLRLDLTRAEIDPCVAALDGGPDFRGRSLCIVEIDGTRCITLAATSLRLDAGPDVRRALATHLSRRGTGHRAVAGEIGGPHAG